MRSRPNALRIGLFAIVGIALLVAAIASVSGGKLFAHTERAVMYFRGSIYGLQVGAPVVFRGVRIGNVVSIGVVHDARSGRFAVPVVAEVNRDLFREAPIEGAPTPATVTIASLVQRGLQARLLMQSLLTGQLYVDLDIVDGAAITTTSAAAAAGASAVPATPATPSKASTPSTPSTPATADMTEIPTTVARSLQAQLEGLDLRQLGSDLSAMAASARQLITSPQTQQTLADLGRVTASLARTSVALESRIAPLVDTTQATLSAAQRAASSVLQAADRVAGSVDRAAGKVASAAGRADALLAPDSALLQSLQTAAQELSRSAASLRQTTSEDSEVMRNVDGALQEVRRAARAVRGLAEQLERQPDSLIRGRTETP